MIVKVSNALAEDILRYSIDHFMTFEDAVGALIRKGVEGYAAEFRDDGSRDEDLDPWEYQRPTLTSPLLAALSCGVWVRERDLLSFVRAREGRQDLSKETLKAAVKHLHDMGLAERRPPYGAGCKVADSEIEWRLVKEGGQ